MFWTTYSFCPARIIFLYQNLPGCTWLILFEWSWVYRVMWVTGKGSRNSEQMNIKVKHCQRYNSTGVEFISQVLTQILIKVHFCNLDLTLTLKSQPNISILKLRILTKASFRILTWPRFNFVTSTKNQQQNTNHTSASKSCLSFNFISWPNFLL